MNPNRIAIAFQSLKVSLRAVATRLTGNADDADDTIQDVFLRLWSSAEDIPEPKNLNGYISVAVRNRALDMVRSRNSVRQEDISDLPDTPVDSQDADSEEIFNAVSRIIENSLPPLQREILLLRDRDQLEFSEIAEKLNIPETTIRVYLSRARATVRKIHRQSI